MNESYSFQVSLPLCVTFLLAWLLYSNRRGWKIPLPSANLAMPFLVILWVAGLNLGQTTGSLAGMAWVAAIVLLAFALLIIPRSWHAIKVLDPPQWSFLDLASFGFLVYVFLRFGGNDPYCHYSVTATIIRGNIPPSSLNDPTFPLIYHSAFNLPAAVLTKGLGSSIETGLDLASLVCIYAVIDALQHLSRVFFQTRWAQQCSRLFFLFGLGPTYLNPFQPVGMQKLHGGTVQSYAEAIFRRPEGLDFVVFTFLLSILLYILLQHGKTKEDSDPKYLFIYLLPVAFLLPLTSEELAVYATIAVVLLCIFRRVRYRFGVLWLIAMGASLPLSGVFRAHFAASTPTLVPKVTFGWPLLLPRWPEAGAVDYSAPLFSRALVEVLVFEWGPIFFVGMLLPFLYKERFKMALVALILVSFLPAFMFRVEDWVQADLDRFLFYGTALGFFLAAKPVEVFERKPHVQRRKYFLVPILVFYVVATICAPVIFLFGRTSDRSVISPYDRFLSDGVKMRRALHMVGPKDQVKSDLETAQRLVLSGFVVAAPMSSNALGVITPEKPGAYSDSPDWLLLPEKDPRVARKRKFAKYDDLVLIRARERKQRMLDFTGFQLR